MFRLVRCNEDIDVLAKNSPLVSVNEKSTYIRNAFDVGPECGGCATKEADVLRAKVGFD